MEKFFELGGGWPISGLMRPGLSHRLEELSLDGVWILLVDDGSEVWILGDLEVDHVERLFVLVRLILEIELPHDDGKREDVALHVVYARRDHLGSHRDRRSDVPGIQRLR